MATKKAPIKVKPVAPRTSEQRSKEYVKQKKMSRTEEQRFWKYVKRQNEIDEELVKNRFKDLLDDLKSCDGYLEDYDRRIDHAIRDYKFKFTRDEIGDINKEIQNLVDTLQRIFESVNLDRKFHVYFGE
jgi:hypothetical protein